MRNEAWFEVSLTGKTKRRADWCGVNDTTFVVCGRCARLCNVWKKIDRLSVHWSAVVEVRQTTLSDGYDCYSFDVDVLSAPSLGYWF